MPSICLNSRDYLLIGLTLRDYISEKIEKETFDSRNAFEYIVCKTFMPADNFIMIAQYVLQLPTVETPHAADHRCECDSKVVSVQ